MDVDQGTRVFFYKNYKTIAAVFSIMGVLVGIFKALFSEAALAAGRLPDH